jgi:hypothetical protein
MKAPSSEGAFVVSNQKGKPVCCHSHNHAQSMRGLAIREWENGKKVEYFPQRDMRRDGYPLPGPATIRVEFSTSPEDRCRCTGFSTDHSESGECPCFYKLDGEDLRCAVCRHWCDDNFTPRIMSEHAQRAVAGA